MPIHFGQEEMAGRLDRAVAALRERELDGLIMFKQESMYWLTGYDTFGFAMFQALVLNAEGEIALLTRAPDLRTAWHTSMIEDVRVWADIEGVDPTQQLLPVLADLGLTGGRVGIELDSYGLKASNWIMLERSLQGVVAYEDASTVIQELRRTKSAQELVYIRRAADLADEAWTVAQALAAPGVSEAEILAGMQAAILGGGGDYAGNEIIIGSGPSALMVRYTSGRRALDANDQLTLEWAGAYRRYHAAMMRTMLIGDVAPEHCRMHEAAEQALVACEAAIQPGATLGEVFDVHAEVLDRAGYKAHRLNACGYGMGAVYAPIWVDWPMLHHGNPLRFAADQVYFLHMILLNSTDGRAMTLGHSVVVTEAGCERLSRAPLGLVTA